jgi:hypothetical protein
VLSAIVEIKVQLVQVPEILRIVTESSTQIDTLISVGVSTRCRADGTNRLEEVLDGEGYAYWRGKTNLGLGRITDPRS